MTFDDLYVTVTLLAIVLSIAAVIGWSIDRWPEWRARNEAHRLDAAFAYHLYEDRMTKLRWPGTVQNPADPSPAPRRLR